MLLDPNDAAMLARVKRAANLNDPASLGRMSQAWEEANDRREGLEAEEYRRPLVMLYVIVAWCLAALLAAWLLTDWIMPTAAALVNEAQTVAANGGYF